MESTKGIYQPFSTPSCPKHRHRKTKDQDWRATQPTSWLLSTSKNLWTKAELSRQQSNNKTIHVLPPNGKSRQPLHRLTRWSKSLLCNEHKQYGYCWQDPSLRYSIGCYGTNTSKQYHTNTSKAVKARMNCAPFSICSCPQTQQACVLIKKGSWECPCVLVRKKHSMHGLDHGLVTLNQPMNTGDVEDTRQRKDHSALSSFLQAVSCIYLRLQQNIKHRQSTSPLAAVHAALHQHLWTPLGAALAASAGT